MAEIQKYSIKERLLEADEKLQGDPSVLGMTSLTYPNYINSMRSTMLTAHLKQYLNLLHPDSPLVFTNNENLIGKYNDAYKETTTKYKIVKKIEKFKNIIDKPRMYYLFVYDKKNDEYDIIERQVCNNLTENFGYDYDNTVIDSYKVGDTIPKNTVLYKSTSYDQDMNYGYGKNITTIYTLDPYTSEDAAIISESLHDALESVEVDVVSINLNDNDYLLNWYGDKKNYKPLPDIGEFVNDILAVSRSQYNNQLLFDFKDTSLTQIHEGDQIYFVSQDVEVIDYTIYDNTEEDKTSPFYTQINKYLFAQREFYQEILDTIVELEATGSKISGNLDYLKKRANEMLDKNKRWKDGDSMFSNMEIKVLVHRKSKMSIASKLTGRYGNKSVVAKVRPDDEMPYTKDGRRIDIEINLLAIINRTTALILEPLHSNM